MIRKLLFIFLLLSPMAVLSAQRFNVQFVNPGFATKNPTGDFWYNVSNVMTAAANNMNISLKISYAQRNHILMKSLVDQALKSDADYLVLVNEKSSVVPYLLNTKATNIKIIFLLNGPTKTEEVALLKAGYQIIGTIEPDNFQAGFKLMHQLARKALRSSNPSQHVLALLGDVATTAALDRQKGMRAYLEQHKELELIAEANCQWSQNEAYRLTKAWLQRDSAITTVWAANDPIAYGALLAAQELNRKIVIGGINWDEDIAPKLNVSIGGHVLLGAYTLARLAQYHRDFTPIDSVTLSIFESLDDDSLPLYHAIHGNFPEHLDFLRYINDPTQFTITELTHSLNKNNHNNNIKN